MIFCKIFKDLAKQNPKHRVETQIVQLWKSINIIQKNEFPILIRENHLSKVQAVDSNRQFVLKKQNGY